MTLPREMATQKADLPHPFDVDLAPLWCRVCHGLELDPKHVAWEKAAQLVPEPAGIPRERGA